MKKKNVYLLSLSLLIISTVFFLGKRLSNTAHMENTGQERTYASTTKAYTPQRMTEKPDVKNKTKNQLSTITKKDLKDLRDTFPDQNKVKEEVSNNPHSTPKSLTIFANKMGPLMEKAYNQKSDAQLLAGELINCANDKSVALSARALCASNMEKLSKVHPTVNAKINIDPEVQQLLNKKKSFLVE